MEMEISNRIACSLETIKCSFFSFAASIVKWFLNGFCPALFSHQSNKQCTEVEVRLGKMWIEKWFKRSVGFSTAHVHSIIDTYNEIMDGETVREEGLRRQFTWNCYYFFFFLVFKAKQRLSITATESNQKKKLLQARNENPTKNKMHW